jgi:hypothetical protein
MTVHDRYSYLSTEEKYTIVKEIVTYYEVGYLDAECDNQKAY